MQCLIRLLSLGGKLELGGLVTTNTLVLSYAFNNQLTGQDYIERCTVAISTILFCVARSNLVAAKTMAYVHVNCA